LSDQHINGTVSRVKSFGAVCRDVRVANGLSQMEVAEAGGLEQSRVSEIERGRYLPGLDLAVRLAKGLGVTLTEIVAQWEGASADVVPGSGRRRVRRRLPPAPLDVPQEDLFRRVRGLWELLSPERREVYWKQGKALVAEQWKAELRPEPSVRDGDPVKSRRPARRRER
jgi:transcriptional regulator with XRE-family HTH domain